MNGRRVARGLAWFGIGLGVAELLAPRVVARAAGIERHSGLVQAFGLREVASGVLVLAAPDPEQALWLRVAGDGMDGALLAGGMAPGNPHRGRSLLAALAVAPVVMLDAFYAWRSRR